MNVLSEIEVTAARDDVPRDLGMLPFEHGAAFTRSLWVIFIGAQGIWTHAALPVDDRLDLPDREHITRLSDVVAMFLTRPLCHDHDEEALIVLRRPADAAISEADAYVFRMVCEATANRDTAPWTFHVAGPDGARQCFRQTARQHASVPREPAVVPE
jgi:hypothetical protein